MVSKKGQRSRQACETDLWLIIGLPRAFVLGASCRTRGLRSLISCLQHLNVSLYHRGAFLKVDRNGGCCFDDDWACPPVVEADDNLRHACLERECSLLIAVKNVSPLSQSAMGERRGRLQDSVALPPKRANIVSV